jgi:hypothetical protein
MNTQLSPDEIGRYKQEMMKMYQGTGKAQGGGTAQRTAAISPAAPPVQAAFDEANEIAAPDLAAEANQTAPPTAEKSSLTVIAGRNTPSQPLPAKAPAAAADAETSPKFGVPDLNYFEQITNTDPEPEYSERTARLQIPDTGGIAAPGTDETAAPAPRPPAGGTYYPDTGGIGVPDYPGIPSTGPADAPAGAARPPVSPPAPPSNIQTPDTGYIAAPDFPEDEMGTGYLRVQVHTANRAIPVPDAMLIITEETPLGRKLVRMSITDENGYSDLIPLEVPVYPLDEFPNPEQKPFRDYRLSTFADGYYIVPRIEVPIFANVKSLQSVEMVPLAENTSPLSLFPSSTSESDTSITSIEFEQT